MKTEMGPVKKLRKRVIYSLNELINRLRREGKR
jgi:hypothetical protein